MSEIVAVVDAEHTPAIDKIVEQMKTIGVDVGNINQGEGVVEGTVESEKVRQIDALPGVEYVRTVFTYAANYPPGDPRDRDGL
ncbi:MAG: hypothetical protein JO353_01255 [Phycisphaerae bacterium]|nr:hypothetical protein [Phycisphaerae bacterium]